MIDAIVAREIKKTKLKKNILIPEIKIKTNQLKPVSYTHLRAHET